MKIGLISDIHADYPSLIKALRIFKQVGVNKIVCAGDLVEKGEDGDEVVRVIRELNIPCVMGNHDEMAPGNQQWIQDNMDASHPRTKNMLLKSDTLDYLEQLPRKLRFEWEATRILLVHGSPASNIEYLMPTTHINRFASHTINARADIIIYGHTHSALHYVVNNVHFINPGSVCKGDYRTTCSCAVLSLPDKEVRLYQLEDGTHQLLLPTTPPD